MGPGAFLVEQAPQGTASRYLQRSCRDRDDKTLFPRAIQEEALPHARVGLLRVARHTPEGEQPWYFTVRDGTPVLTIAGLWDECKNRETGERLKSSAIMVTEPNEFVAEVHVRMPVLLKPEQFEHWLRGDMGAKELKPLFYDYLQRWAVSKRVNSSKADSNDPTLIDAVKQAA